VSADHLVRRNAGGGSTRAAVGAAGLPAAPGLQTVLVTCMDTRIDPAVVFGLKPGDVHVLRNAGGVVTEDVVRSIVVSQRKLGTREVVLVRHTGCGMATITDESFAGELQAATGQRPPWPVHAFADAAAGVRADAARLRADPFVLPDTPVHGYVLDIAAFTLTPCT